MDWNVKNISLLAELFFVCTMNFEYENAQFDFLF